MQISSEVWKVTCDTIVEACREYGKEEEANRKAEKQELGKDYDPNCYGAGFSEGVTTAARQLMDIIRALPCPVE